MKYNRTCDWLKFVTETQTLYNAFQINIKSLNKFVAETHNKIATS